MTHSTGPWAHPPRKPARCTPWLTIAAVAVLSIILATVTVKAVANMAHDNQTRSAYCPTPAC